jgi:transposase-like protein
MANGQRDSKREALWRGVLARQCGSGLSVRAFCRREKVSEPSFYAWRRVLRQRDQQRPRPAFVPLMVRDHQGDDGGEPITIDLRGGRVLRLPALIAAARLAELVHAIEAAPLIPEARP